MNNLLTRTLFISLLLSTAALPAMQDNKTKSNHWKRIARRTAERAAQGAVVGAVMGMGIGATIGEQVGKYLAITLSKINFKQLNKSRGTLVFKEENVIKLDAMKALKVLMGDKDVEQAMLNEGAKKGGPMGILIGACTGGLIGGLIIFEKEMSLLPR